MATKAGVWIDHKRAIVVLVTDAGKEIKKVAFDIGQAIRSTGGSRSKNPYKPNQFVAEDRLERKLGNDRNNYYDDVIASIRGADGLLILGPGEAKGEFFKRLQSKKLRGIIAEVKTADKMTDRQIAAKVALHFAAPAPTNLLLRRRLQRSKIHGRHHENARRSRESSSRGTA